MSSAGDARYDTLTQLRALDCASLAFSSSATKLQCFPHEHRINHDVPIAGALANFGLTGLSEGPGSARVVALQP
jgi:hypothetical protein